MKRIIVSLVGALALAGCASTSEAELAAHDAARARAQADASAQQAAEQQAAMDARANAARDIARAQQAQRELAAQEAAARRKAEEEYAASEAAQQARAEAEAAAERALQEQAKAQAEARLAAEKAAAEKLAADRLAAEKAAAEAAAAKARETGVTQPSTDQALVAELDTTAGTLVLGFFPDVAPGHVKNFLDLARQGFYDGTRFHRVIPGFMIQGGDPFSKDPARKAQWGTGDPGYKIKAEFSNRPHQRGTLSMARSRDPDSAGSQFFVCHEAAPHLDRGYTVFGELLAGYDVLDRIAAAPNQPGSDRPVDPVTVRKVTLRARTADDTRKDGKTP
jgi:peptidyl-prolyl cis-trans isomerase B (cyclophilin B)